MIETGFYSFSMIIWLVITAGIWNLKKYSNDKILGFMVLSLYTFIGIMAFLLVSFNIFSIPEISLFAYIYLLIILIFFLSPFLLKNNFEKKNLVNNLNILYILIAYIYIFSTFIFVIISYPRIIELFSTGGWQSNYFQVQFDELPPIYENRFEWLALIFISYFRLIALVIYFSMMAKRTHSKLRTLLILSISISVFFSAILISSRGMILDFVILFTIMHLFFRNDYSNTYVKKKRRSFLNVILLTAFSVPVYIFLRDVSIDRFSNSYSIYGSVIGSIIGYFGQPPLVFNYGAFNNESMQYGLYSFGELFDLLGFNVALSSSLTNVTWTRGFSTFVSPIFIDFGHIGVIILGLLFFVLFKIILQQKKFMISTVYLIYIFYSYLLQGAFTIGRGYIIRITGYILIFLVLTLFEKLKIKRIT